MDTIQLVIPTEEYLDQVWVYRQECLDADSHLYGCGILEKCETPSEWLAKIQLYSNPATVPENQVQTTYFLAVRESDSKVVGMLNLRHYFNEYYEKYAGHIGYSVRPSERRRGYAKEILRQALLCCKKIGLDRVLVTCEPDNPGSRRTILVNGGVYEGTVHELNEDYYLERYWITI